VASDLQQPRLEPDPPKLADLAGLTTDLSFVAQVMDCTSINQTWELHKLKMLEYGFDRMSYGANRNLTFGRFGDLKDSILLSSHPAEYFEQFMGRGLYLSAPATQWAAANYGTLSWQWCKDRRANGETSDAENMVMDFNAKWGVTAGYTISFNELAKRNKSAVGLCARKGLVQSEVDAIWADKGAEIELLNRLVNLRIATLPFSRQGKPLTDRQREVLQWVADGKTLQDIALILDLNPGTVEKHLRLARERLNVDTTAQAIAKAAAQNELYK